MQWNGKKCRAMAGTQKGWFQKSGSRKELNNYHKPTSPSKHCFFHRLACLVNLRFINARFFKKYRDKTLVVIVLTETFLARRDTLPMVSSFCSLFHTQGLMINKLFFFQLYSQVIGKVMQCMHLGFQPPCIEVLCQCLSCQGSVASK